MKTFIPSIRRKLLSTLLAGLSLTTLPTYADTPKSSTQPGSTTAWSCKPFLTLSTNAAPPAGGTRLYTATPFVRCTGSGSGHVHVDVTAFSTKLDGTDRIHLGAKSSERNGVTTSFDGSALDVNMPTAPGRKLVVESMMLTIDDATRNEVITITTLENAVEKKEAVVDVSSPSSPSGPLSMCENMVDNNCNYAVVGQNDVPNVPPFKGMAQRKAQNPWRADPNAFFSFPSGVSYDKTHIYLPIQFEFDAGVAQVGSQVGPCSIDSFKEATTKVRLSKRDGSLCSATGVVQALTKDPSNPRKAMTGKVVFDMTQASPTTCTLDKFAGVELDLAVTVVADTYCVGTTSTERTVMKRLPFKLMYPKTTSPSGITASVK